MARLTPDLIVSAAIDVIATHGVDQFSVRKLGEAIGADPTAIYRHFRSKDELLRAIGDRCLLGVTDRLPESPWRERVRTVCVRVRAANLAQPALATLVRGAPPRHANELLITETILSSLRQAGFDPHGAAHAYHALVELTVGSATIDAMMASEPAPAREQIYAEWRGDYARLDPAEFPSSVELAGSLYPGSADDRFEFALDRLLEGLQAELAAGAAEASGRLALSDRRPAPPR